MVAAGLTALSVRTSVIAVPLPWLTPGGSCGAAPSCGRDRRYRPGPLSRVPHLTSGMDHPLEVAIRDAFGLLRPVAFSWSDSLDTPTPKHAWSWLAPLDVGGPRGRRRTPVLGDRKGQDVVPAKWTLPARRINSYSSMDGWPTDTVACSTSRKSARGEVNAWQNQRNRDVPLTRLKALGAYTTEDRGRIPLRELKARSLGPTQSQKRG